MKNRNKKWFYKLGFILSMMILFIIGCSGKENEKESIRPVLYQIISTSGSGNQFTIPGVVRYNQESRLSFKVGGVIKSINVTAGKKVKKGKVLATLDDTDYIVGYKQAQSSYKAAIAAVKNAKAQLTNAKSNFMRIEQLYINNNTSLSDFEKAKAQYENAMGGLEVAESQAEASSSQVTVKKNQLNYTKLISPSSGVISEVFKEENEQVGTGVPIMVLASDSGFEVQALVPETWVSQLKKKQEVEVFISSLNKTFKGIIKEITPNAPSNAGYPIKISFENNIKNLKSGMSVKVQITNAKRDSGDTSLIVDTDAVSKDADGYFVYVLVKDKGDNYSANRRNIEVGELTKNGYIINSGLENNEMIATAGIRFLYDGKIVKLQEQRIQ
jgi:RND family efflux transporter MFP subunit